VRDDSRYDRLRSGVPLAHEEAGMSHVSRSLWRIRARWLSSAGAASIGLLAAGCSGSSPAGCGEDVCSPADAGVDDTGRLDAGKRDAGARDAGSRDAGKHDAGVGDAGHGEAGAPDSAPGSCSFQGETLASGASVTAFQSATVPAGSICVSQSRTCNAGTLSGTYAYASCSVAAPTTPAFYVSPSGDDTNPGTLAQPFLTLPKAQTAMRASASIKTTLLRAGTYAAVASTATSNCDASGSTAIDLGASDDGETWSYYPPDGYGTAIIDGGSTSTTTGLACGFAASGASNLTFIGLQLQRFQYSAIYANASPNLSVKDNTIHDLTVAVYNVGGIALHASSGASVENNYIHDVAYMGIGAWGAGMSNTTVSGTVVLSSCGATAQPGGIYLWDGVTHASTNIAVTNNYVRDVNVSSNGAGDYTGCCATGLYLDDGMSNVTVSGNVVTGTKSQCFVIHGGNDDTFKDNLCDLDDSTYERIMTYQWDALKLPMSGNVIEDNVIVSSAATGGTGYSDDGTPTAPTIKNNAYYNYAGTMVVSSGGNGSDANPTYENPGIACWDPSLPASSPVYAAPVSFVKLAGGWGPPGFVLPQTGTAPSWPHGC
jgi:hypothetical protein